MTEQEQRLFRQALRCLPFCGVKLRDFAMRNHIAPHTLYNYINGQRPSETYYQFLLRVIERDVPEAIEQAKLFMEGDENVHK